MPIVVTVTQDDTDTSADVFVDVTCGEGDDVTRAQALAVLVRAMDVILQDA
jgi:hypothetical protein